MNHLLKKTILHLTKYIPDQPYLRIMYRVVTKKKLHLNPPITFNEKLQWLKLHNRKPEYTSMVDKYEVRDYVSKRVGAQYLIPCLGIWETPKDIDFSKLPDKFVLKCTHDCKGLVICKDKKTFDTNAAIAQLNHALKRNFYYQGREWPYKNVKPRIVGEMYMEDAGTNQLTDYKVFNFHGEPKLIEVDYDRFNGHKRQFFDPKWNSMNISFHHPSDTERIIPKPEKLNEMLLLAKELSKGIPHLRTDFYIVDNQIYVGEMTFYHGTGMGRWTPDSFDRTMGEWLDLTLCE